VVLLASAACTATSFAAFAALPSSAPAAAYPVIALVCGLALPPVSASVRVVWGQLVDDLTFQRVVTLDASLQEIAFLAGPFILVTGATQAGADTALVATGLGWALVTVAFAALPETRAVLGARRPDHASILGPVTDRGVRTLLLVAIAMGFCIGATELGVVHLAEDHDAVGLLAVLYGLWSLGSLAGGLLSMRHPGRDIVRRAQVLLVVVTVATAVLAFAAGPISLAALLLFAGVANAPLFGALYTIMAGIAPPAMRSEAYSLQTSGLTIGIALGFAVAGVITDAGGSRGMFLAGAVGMLAGVLVHRANTDALRPVVVAA
jgi:predicted MFS family arabinose efflux permease